jgi:hypothetical protein
MSWSMLAFFAVFVLAGGFVGVIVQRLKKPAQKGDPLNRGIFRWSRDDVFRVRDLLRSIAIWGASGSGKTSGSGFQIARALFRDANTGGLIIASKPEDRKFWEKIAAQVGRPQDLLIFEPRAGWRMNLLETERKSGADTRELTQLIMTISETLKRGEGGNGQEVDSFWNQQYERLFYNAIGMVRLATGKVSAPDLHKFIATAATTPEQLANEGWMADFHNRCLKAAFEAPMTPVEANDCQLAFDYWLGEFPRMADKTRSSIIAGVMGLMHVWNTGIVRELMSTTTNITAAVMGKRKFVLVDTSVAEYGQAGAFIIGAWKMLTQRYVLRRHVRPDDAVIVIWADEAQNVVNSFDSQFLAMCRSYRGCMVYLTQSLHSYYSALKGRNGEHQTDGLLTNFGTKIFHQLGDARSAEYGASLIGKSLQTLVGSSMAPTEDLWQELTGQSKITTNTSEHMDYIVQPRQFLTGLRTGGPQNDYCADAIVIRSEPFADGHNFKFIAFSQR